MADEELPPLFVADIGGTHIRLATVTGTALTQVEASRCDELGPEAIIASYLERHNLSGAILCIAIASPVTGGDIVAMTNFNWSFSQTGLAENLGLSGLFVINDFHAMSLCVPSLGPDDTIRIGGEDPDPARARVICGPGTGMGLGHLLPAGEDWIVMSGEGGHGDFAANSELEADIWEVMHRELGHVCIESLLSGPGLEKLYQVLCMLEEKQPHDYSAADISTHAMSGGDPMCRLALTTFCEMFGSWCGSVAINAGALAGVYIAGGMIPKFLEFFLASPFRHRFDAKGSYSGYTAKIPVFIITHAMPGLLGTAEYMRGRLISRGYSFSRAPFEVI